MPPVLTVALLNVFAGNRNPARALQVLLGPKPDTVGINEGSRAIPLALKRRGYREFHGTGSSNDRRGPKDTPILTRKVWPSLGAMALQVSEEVQPVRIAPARWITVSCFRHPVGPVAHINLHPNAAVQDRDEELPRVREYRESMESLDRLLGFLKGEGFLTVVTGDMNFRPEPPARRPDHSPYEVFARHKLTHRHDGLDVIAWPRKELRLVRSVVLEKEATGSDHPGLMVWLSPTEA